MIIGTSYELKIKISLLFKGFVPSPLKHDHRATKQLVTGQKPAGGKQKPD